MERILIIIPNLDLGGTETVVMNYFKNINRKEMVFDFVVHGKEGFYEKEAKELGARIFRVPTRGEGFIKNIKAMREIYKQNPEYKTIIVCTEHAFAFIEMAVAWFCGVKIRGAWSHFSDYQGASRIKKMAHFFARPFLRLFTNLFLACTEDAGFWLYGKSLSLHKNNFHIINNAIELDKFEYSEKVRAKIREAYSLGEKFVIGMVARLTAVKNHSFALDVISEIDDAIFLIIGDGELKQELVKKIEELNISDRVIFTGAVSNPSYFYQALDLLLIPSFHEGLTLVAVEAQASGLNVLLSDTITEDLKISEYAHFLSLGIGAKKWADEIKMIGKEKRKSPDLSDSGFCIKNEAGRFQKLLESFYVSPKI